MQEMIDICDFAVGLSRQLYGLTIASERPGHRLTEQWHPLGPVGVITAFNFPVAVWAWNAMLALVCGDPVVWKPSEKTPLCALACQALVQQTCCRSARRAAGDLSSSSSAARDVGQATRGIARACRWSPRPARCRWAAPSRRRSRSGSAARCSNSAATTAMIVAPSADLELAVRVDRLRRRRHLRPALHDAPPADRPRIDRRRAARRGCSGVYARLPIGDPRDEGTLVGPLIDERAGATRWMRRSSRARQQGGKVHGGGRVTDGVPAGGCLRAAGDRRNRARRARSFSRKRSRRFCTCMRYETLDEAIAIHNAVPQGLSSAIFTSDVREAELLLLARRLRLRHRQRQHRHQRRRDRRRVRRREGNRRRPRIRHRRLESVHAPRHEHGQLLGRPAARAGNPVRRRSVIRRAGLLGPPERP